MKAPLKILVNFMIILKNQGDGFKIVLAFHLAGKLRNLQITGNCEEFQSLKWEILRSGRKLSCNEPQQVEL